MNIEVVPAKKSQKLILSQLMELYNHDFSEYTKEDIDEHGFFGYPYLDLYWIEEERHPFFIKVNGCFAGFILVRICKDIANEKTHRIAEFFVMRKYRGMSVGSFAAKHVFNLFKGEWEVKVLNANKPALVFWDKVISEYTNGRYIFNPVPSADWDGIGYTFSS